MTLRVLLAYSVSAAFIAVASCELANDSVKRQPMSNEVSGQNELFHDQFREESGSRYKELATRSSNATAKEDKNRNRRSSEINLDELGFEVGHARGSNW